LIIYLVTPAQAGVQKKNNNINFILDTGLRRYDEEEMKFHTSIRLIWPFLFVIPGLPRARSEAPALSSGTRADHPAGQFSGCRIGVRPDEGKCRISGMTKKKPDKAYDKYAL
jgi:hypothetical protein